MIGEKQVNREGLGAQELDIQFCFGGNVFSTEYLSSFSGNGRASCMCEVSNVLGLILEVEIRWSVTAEIDLSDVLDGEKWLLREKHNSS